MKPQLTLTFVLLLVQLQFMSCKKDDCESCTLPPKTTLRAKAGPGQAITLPTNSIFLDGSQSTPVNGKITYSWSKISGPASFRIMDAASAKTEVTNLVRGYYQFELTVTDERGISSKDTIEVAVTGSPGNSLHWTQLENLPDDEFSGDFNNNYNTFFNGSNFFMGIDNQLFAVSNQGGVWRFTGAWNKIGTFPEAMGTLQVVFSINNKGYCMGISLGKSHLWEYDPAGNLWQRKKDAPEYIKNARVALVIGDKVYLVSIETTHVMMYDPLTDTYSPKNNFPGTEPTTGFVVNEAGFCIGADGRSWKYEPSTDSWQQKASLPPSIVSMSGFSLKDDGYVIGDLNLAANNNNELMKVWRYETKADKWHEFEEDYPGYGAGQINTVSMDDHAVVGLGKENDEFNINTIDLWRFK